MYGSEFLYSKREEKNNSDCDCMQKATPEIRELKLKDATLAPYFKYLEKQVLLPESLNLGELSWMVRSSKSYMELS